MAESVFEAVKQSITVREAAQMYGIEVNRSGMACCPFHDDKNPSMKLNEEYFYCFGCGATGDVIDFTARLYNLSPKEAAEKLAQDFGLAYDSQAPPRRRHVRQKSEAQKFKEDRDHAFRVLADYFHQLLKYFPQEIETNKGFIKGFEADLETLAAHPHPEDGFAGMEIRGDVLTDKENAGAALLDACKEVKGSEPVQIGSYRGFTMSVEFSAWKQEYTLLLKGQMTHRASLGTDPRGNLTRIDNALAQMPQRLEAVKNQLDNLYQQQAAAKEEIGKPFPFEDDLRVKSARLVELDTLLNIDGKGHAQPETVVAKSARPSVLDSLKRPVPPRSPEKKPKQHEEVR